MRRGTGLPRNAITLHIGSQAPAHGIFPEPASNQAGGGHDNVENDAENDSCVDPAQDMPDRHPPFVGPKKAFGERKGWNDQKSRNHDGPPTGAFVVENNRPKTDESKDAANGQTERPQLLVCDLVLHSFTSVSC